MLPVELVEALTAVFSSGVGGTALVGGSAIAGFYSGHRRSDDLDLFAPDAEAQMAAVRAVRRLADVGFQEVHVYQSTRDFFSVLLRKRGYSFKTQVVLDPWLHEAGSFHQIDHGIRIASLDTLFNMKSAAIVSRCSEKDLYDVMWFLAHRVEECTYEELFNRGRRIDRGVNGETMLMSLTGAMLSQEACDFALAPALTNQELFTQVSAFRDCLAEGISIHLHRKPGPTPVEIARGIVAPHPGRG